MWWGKRFPGLTLDTWTPLYASEPVLVTRHTLDGKTITINPADGHVSTTASAITCVEFCCVFWFPPLLTTPLTAGGVPS